VTISVQKKQEIVDLETKDCPVLNQDLIRFGEKAVSMNMMETYALRIKSKHVLMLFDSCFSGSVFASLKSLPSDISEKSNLPVRQFITAGNEEEQVPDNSIFNTCLIQGIKVMPILMRTDTLPVLSWACIWIQV
ncbi:MAG: hypothetical protein ACE5GV_10340, partial [Candidatus Scalindua sp.]